jgi:predicted enzyme related to lactoylglutathione lyase
MSTGRFLWFDLMTTDPAASRAFYGTLLGWDVRDHGPDYLMIHVDGQPIGGMVGTKPGEAPNAWIAYVSTDDLPATLAKVREQGGQVLVQKAIDDLGEFAVILDRQGAAISAFRYVHETAGPRAPKGAGAISWAELHTTDPDDALAFYQAIFGWSSETWGGDYILVGDDHDAGILKGQEGVPPHWLLYASVADIVATAERVRALGGEVLAGPQDIPEVGRFAVFRDPVGAVMAAMESFRKD